MKHIRKAYSFLDLLGDIAGLFELFVTIFGILLFSASRHSMTLSTVQELFVVKTKDTDLFKKEIGE